MRTMLFVLLAMPVHAQVVLKPHFEPERVDRFRLEASLTVEQEGEEAVETRTYSQSVEFRTTTVHVDPSGRAEVSLVFERVGVEAGEGEAAEYYAWPDGDEDSTLADAWSLMVNDVLRLTVDPSGRIRTVDGLEAIAERLEGVRGGESHLGLLAPNSLKRSLMPIWGIDFIGDEREPGDEWRIADRLSVSGERRIELLRTYTLEAMDKGVASINLQLDVEALPVTTPTIVDVSIHGEGEGHVAWSIDRGVLDTWRESSTIELDASLQDEPPIKTRLIRQVTLTRLADDS